jgi:hypothetical protein
MPSDYLDRMHRETMEAAAGTDLYPGPEDVERHRESLADSVENRYAYMSGVLTVAVHGAARAAARDDAEGLHDCLRSALGAIECFRGMTAPELRPGTSAGHRPE